MSSPHMPAITSEKKLLVSAIKNGTVIDHIKAGHALKIIRILNLAACANPVTVGLNLPSKSMVYKDLIKVGERELTPDEANRVAIFAPDASINIIRNYRVVKKFKVNIPEQIKRIIICPNPKCVTNNERAETRLRVEQNGAKEMRLRCAYCEKRFELEEIREYNV